MWKRKTCLPNQRLLQSIESQAITLAPVEPCPVEAMTASASFTTVISNDTIPFIVNRMTTRLGTVMASDMGSMILMIAPLLPSACSEVPQKFVSQLSVVFGALFGPAFEILLQGNVGKYASDIPYELIADTIDETVDERRRKLSTRSTVYGVWKKSVKKMLTVIRRLKRRAHPGRALAGDDEETLPTCYDLEDAYYTAREDDDEEGDDDDDAIFAIIEEALSFILTPSEVSNNCLPALFEILDRRRLSEATLPSSNLTLPNCRCEEEESLSMSRVQGDQKYNMYAFMDSSSASVSDTEDMESLEYIDPMIMLADHVNMTAYAASNAQFVPLLAAMYTTAGFSITNGPSVCRIGTELCAQCLKQQCYSKVDLMTIR